MDQIGTTRLVTGPTAAVVARHDFLPFGKEITSTGGRTAQWGSTTDVDQKFTGRLRDTESSLDFFNARCYGFALNRFTSPDPGNAGADPTNPQSWNGYAYVMNSPLSGVDPSGMDLDWVSSFGGWLSGLFGGGGGGSASCGATFCDTVTERELAGSDPGDGVWLGAGLIQSGGTGGGGGANFKVTGTGKEDVPTVGTPPNPPIKLTGPFKTLDCAGYKAARSILPQTRKLGIEFGGFLYKKRQNLYSYSNAVSGTPTSIPSLFSSPKRRHPTSPVGTILIRRSLTTTAIYFQVLIFWIQAISKRPATSLVVPALYSSLILTRRGFRWSQGWAAEPARATDFSGEV